MSQIEELFEYYIYKAKPIQGYEPNYQIIDNAINKYGLSNCKQFIDNCLDNDFYIQNGMTCLHKHILNENKIQTKWLHHKPNNKLKNDMNPTMRAYGNRIGYKPTQEELERLDQIMLDYEAKSKTEEKIKQTQRLHKQLEERKQQANRMMRDRLKLEEKKKQAQQELLEREKKKLKSIERQCNQRPYIDPQDFKDRESYYNQMVDAYAENQLQPENLLKIL